MPVLVVSLAALAGGVVSALWVGIFGGTIDAIMPSTMYLGAAAAVAGYVYGAYYIAGFVRKRAPRWFEDASPIGIAWSGASVRFLIAGAVCGVLLAAGILVMSELLPPPPQQVPVAWKMLAPELQWFSVRFFVFNVVAIAPVLEEFVFRGVLVASSVRRWGLPVACIGSVLAFALMHVGYLVNWWPGFFLVSLMGATCLVLRLWSRSLGPAIACHSAYNFGLLVLSVAVLAT
jgi:membrane protease YdiL (CAAX protease family)